MNYKRYLNKEAKTTYFEPQMKQRTSCTGKNS
jgi:hypothetical protein